MDSKATVDISNTLWRCSVTLDRISLGYRKAQMALMFIRSIIQASSHPIKFTRKHTFNHFHAWFLFVQTFCSSLKVEIFKPVFPQGDKYFNLSLPPVFSTCCFPLKLHLISELYLLMSYCTKLVIFQKTRPFLVSSQWLWFQRAENISLVFSC